MITVLELMGEMEEDEKYITESVRFFKKKCVLGAGLRHNGNVHSLDKHSKTSFKKNCFSAWASTLNMGLINKVDMVCLSPVGCGV